MGKRWVVKVLLIAGGMVLGGIYSQSEMIPVQAYAVVQE